MCPAVDEHGLVGRVAAGLMHALEHVVAMRTSVQHVVGVLRTGAWMGRVNRERRTTRQDSGVRSHGRLSRSDAWERERLGSVRHLCDVVAGYARTGSHVLRLMNPSTFNVVAHRSQSDGWGGPASTTVGFLNWP